MSILTNRNNKDVFDFTTAPRDVPGTPSESCSSDGVTVSQRTDAIVRGLDLVLEHHSVSTLIRDELDKQVHHYLDSSESEMVWLKRAKYLLSYPLAKYLRNELPPAPDRVFSPTGAFRKWMKTYLLSFNRKNTHLWYSWFQAKRSSLPASDDIIEMTYEKHFETLSREDLGDDKIIDRILDLPIFSRLLNKVSNQVKEAVEKEDFCDYSASGSACFENKRSQYGQQGRLRQICGLIDQPYGLELFSMSYYPIIYFKGERGTRANVTVEKRCSYGREQWMSLKENLKCGGNTFVNVPNKCTIQGILEPFKVRVISKGEALPYYSCKPLQKAMHSALRCLSPFRLIGRPFCPTDMMDLKRKSTIEDQWFSVDYSAATDGLSWEYSGSIFQRVIGKLPLEQQMMAMKVLGPHSLHYPDPRLPGSCPRYRGEQRNGQLMGSILSFPILCLANLGVYLLVTNDVQKDWSDEERLNHVLVNGDDMVYSCHPDYWDLHKFVAGKVGLEMSVGKAYIHPVYANINSTSVHYDLRVKNNTPWQIDYLNSGLFFGQRKVQERDSALLNDNLLPSSSPWSRTSFSEKRIRYLLEKQDIDPLNEDQGIVSSINWIMRGSLPARQKGLMKKLLSTQSLAIRAECSALLRHNGRVSIFTRNLFLPLSLGGMGVDKPLNFSVKFKPIQLKVAQYFRTRSSILKADQRPLPGYEVRSIETYQSMPWSRAIQESEVYRASSSSAPFGKKVMLSFQGIPYSLNPSTFFL